jgi:hypothetical protein
MNIKQATDNVGGLSTPGKMPGYGWSISALRCDVGSSLVDVKGSVCEGCYALKGRYRFGNVKNALENRYYAWANNRELWVESMIYLMNHKKMAQHFRWFDSGDLQGREMMDDIAKVAIHSRRIRFWLPSKEYALVKDWLKNNDCPENLIIRVSAPMMNQNIDGFTFTSGVYCRENLYMVKKSTICPASWQENQCKDCRKCWSDRIATVNYVGH